MLQSYEVPCTKNQQMEYRREIDGLRAVAVLPVILFHAGFQTFSGGFVGVDVFFVISGYLITSIILTQKQAGTFSLVKFYERRARRILPALFFVMLSCLPFAWLWLLPSDMKDFSKSVTYVSVFASNVLFYKQSGYFDTVNEMKPLLHTWSLAVEEQYYLFFPLFLILIWRFSKKSIPVVFGAVALVSLLYTQYLLYRNPAAAFYMLSTRIWELLIGALIAYYLMNGKMLTAGSSAAPSSIAPVNRSVLSLLGVLLIAYAVFFFDRTTPFPGLYALIPTLGTGLIILFATIDTPVGRILGNKLLVGIGLISYSAYLWHQPLFVFSRYKIDGGNPSPLLLITLTACALLFAFFSWKYIERPFRDPARVSGVQLAKYLTLAGLSFTVIGTIGYKYEGFEEYYYANRLTEPQRKIYQFVKTHTTEKFHARDVDNGDCNFRSESIDAVFAERFDGCVKKYGKAVVVLGDSHAVNIYNAFFRSNFSKFVVGVTKPGCRPEKPQPQCEYRKLDEFIERRASSIKYVVYHQSGSHFLKDPFGKVDSIEAFAKPKNYAIHHAGIDTIKVYLTTLSAHVTTYWLGPYAEARVDFRNFRQFSDGFQMNAHSLDAFRHLEDELKNTVSKTAYKWKYISLSDILAMDRNFLASGDCLRFRDGDHFSACGEEFLGRQLKQYWSASKI